MGKGGRYLKSATKKKGKGWKIALIVLAVLVVLLGGVAFAALRYYRSMLGLINRAEVETKDVSAQEVLDAATYNPDAFTTGE